MVWGGDMVFNPILTEPLLKPMRGELTTVVGDEDRGETIFSHHLVHEGFLDGASLLGSNGNGLSPSRQMVDTR